MSVDQAEDQRRLISALLVDIEAQQAVTPFDLVLFTGDLTYSGQPAEFELEA